MVSLLMFRKSPLGKAFQEGAMLKVPRIMDFQDVAQWQNNKLDRKDSSRMVSQQISSYSDI